MKLNLFTIFLAVSLYSYGQSARKSVLSQLKSESIDKSTTYTESGVTIKFVDRVSESNSRVNFIQLSFDNAMMSGGSGIILMNNTVELEAFKLELLSVLKHIENSPKADKTIGHVYYYNFDLKHLYLQTDNYRYYCKVPIDGARKIYDHLASLSLN